MVPVSWVLRGNAGDWFEPGSFTVVSFSWLFGLLISFFGFAARRAIYAMAFTVTGVVNKFLTVVISVLIWDKHATPFGLACLLFTLAGGVLYQQSVTRQQAPRESTASKQTGDKNEDKKDDAKDNQGKSVSAKHVSVLEILFLIFHGFGH